MINRSKASGFTLIELLIATTILAISMGALLSTSGQNARNANDLRDRAIAQWVAGNKLAEFQLQKKMENIGKRDGQMEMANNIWYWKSEVKPVNDENLRRIEVSVRRDREASNYLYQVVGFLSSSAVFTRTIKSDN